MISCVQISDPALKARLRGRSRFGAAKARATDEVRVKPEAMTALVAVIAALALTAGAAEAGLRATVRLETKAGPVPGAGGAPMPFAQGPIDMVWMIQDGVVRTELLGEMPGMPKGTVTLRRAGESVMYIVNPADKTYYTIQTGAARSLPKATGVTVKRTGEFETIAGHRAEKVTVEARIPLPSPYNLPPPPGVPTEMTLNGEIWTTDDFGDKAEYRAILQEVQQMSGLASPELNKEIRFPLRTRLTLSMMAGVELLSTVTSVTEEALPPAQFATPPPDFKEVTAPMPMPGRRPMGN